MLKRVYIWVQKKRLEICEQWLSSIEYRLLFENQSQYTKNALEKKRMRLLSLIGKLKNDIGEMDQWVS